MQAGAHHEQEMQWAIRWRDAPHGKRGAVMQAACKALNASSGTLHRLFPKLVVVLRPPRKRRSDAGRCALTFDEAQMISLLIWKHMRMSGKKNMVGVTDALNELRANKLIRAERIDPETGEVFLLSNSTIFRALSQYNLHPKQLAQPAPVTQLRSLHPNHVWQIDASRCVLYYLPRPGSNESGLHIMEAERFNKNKPANLMRAMKAALWRYVITDHASGWVYVQYVLEGETAANAIDVFIGAMQPRQHQPMHGVPKLLMLDLGGANTSAAFASVCLALGVRCWFNAKGNPRGKGQVEKAQDIVERKFESRLKTMPKEEVAQLAQINALASQWCRTFNATEVHSRHGLTRDGAWMRIKPEELVTVPDAALLRKLAVSPAQERQVTPGLTVKFEGREWDVKDVPGVSVGQKLLVCRNAFDEKSAHALGHSEDGMQIYHVLPEVRFNEYGQRVDAPVIGESYRRHADTPVQTNIKAMERLAMDAATDDEAAQKRKSGARFLGGRYDPFATTKVLEASLPLPLPRRGQEHGLEGLQPPAAPVEVLLTHIRAAGLLRERFKDWFEDWDGTYYAQLERLYPQGVPEEQLEAVASELCAAMRRSGIRLVSGAGHISPLQLVA